jgi:heme/copper-type cytochrome/quinol oxidase subunit 2
MAGLVGILGGFVVLMIVSLAVGALVPVALAYVALRVRDARGADPDPELGAKTAFHLINSIGILMALTGLTISMLDLMSGVIAPRPVPGLQQRAFPQRGQAAPQKEGGFNNTQRTAAALTGVGVLFALAFGGILLGTNDRSRRSVMRVFTGGRMALCLLITMLTVAGLAVALVQKDPDHEITESLLAILIVWFAAAVVHLVAFRVATREKREKGTKRNEDEEAWTPRG